MGSDSKNGVRHQRGIEPTVVDDDDDDIKFVMIFFRADFSRERHYNVTPAWLGDVGPARVHLDG